MSIVKVNNMTFGYDGSYDLIFDNVSFQMDTDWKLGFTGRNGRGKTTFMKLLLGKYEYRGTISSSVAFDYFPFEVKEDNMLTVHVLEDVCPAFEQWQLEKELSLLGVDDEVLYRPFNTLSQGEQTKVMLAALFLKENQFLLIDEPTNHLDVEGRKIVSDYLRSKKGFILVSHDRLFLDACIDHILTINKTDIIVQKGNFSSWYLNKTREDQNEINENEKLKKDVKRLMTAMKRTAKWSDDVEATKIGFGPCDRGAIGAKAAKMMKRSKAIETRQTKVLEDKSKLLKNIEQSFPLAIQAQDYFRERLFHFEDVVVSYGESKVNQPVTFAVNRGERIAITGFNGSGKSSLLKLMTNEDIAYSGRLEKGTRLKVSYVSQNTAALSGDLSTYAKERGIDEGQFKTILHKMDMSQIQFEKDMSAFSEGQKKKVLIAASLCEKANIYIWDEPLNYVDVLSRIQIEEAILSYRPTMIFVEHDKTFVSRIATKVVDVVSVVN
ncbi:MULTISPECIES: ribosomal protection-like ABC-F family protein [unclassified Fusibacter]|uniref:ribosomal protection-like ABC-F family protein n=1 Tax=unclassified Fusibacter TaxID=2624464 RepID=UPI001011AAB4|nr:MULTISPECIES: ABC-F type ribosomal protection protein [unclassified Fusibacter]MCK8059310.1 ABC-F type ribosomal protection protein [Fusibacter sp. A2]NPE21226.1 ABC-F type ribosomal protection protein [Fusibacter sp. A1]RXV62494.1 ABC-F type ribosomal protection protein [Fusibacter sp. A1]